MADTVLKVNSYDIASFIEKVVSFYTQGLLSWETLGDIGKEVIEGYAEIMEGTQADDDEDLEVAEDLTTADAIEVLLADAKERGIEVVVGFRYAEDSSDDSSISPTQNTDVEA